VCVWPCACVCVCVCVCVYVCVARCIIECVDSVSRIIRSVNSVSHMIKAGLGISRTNADSQWNTAYKAFYQIRFCGNKAISR